MLKNRPTLTDTQIQLKRASRFCEFAVFGRFCAIYVLEWNWPLNQFKVLFGFYWKPNHDF